MRAVRFFSLAMALWVGPPSARETDGYPFFFFSVMES